MIIAVGNTKGGVGKTTVALNIAIGLTVRDGRDVWLVDGDPQRTAHSALAVRAQSDITPMLACSAYTDGKLLRTQVQQQANKYDTVVIDVGGRDNGALRAALVVADIFLVPFAPSTFDVWALNDVSALIEEVHTIREGPEAYAILNMADPKDTPDNRAAIAAVRDMPELLYLDTPLVDRKAYANATGEGRSVLDYAPVNYQARGETNALLDALNNIIGIR